MIDDDILLHEMFHNSYHVCHSVNILERFCSLFVKPYSFSDEPEYDETGQRIGIRDVKFLENSKIWKFKNNLFFIFLYY